jgi:16S rRNA (guanine966-N2)-methyltransferase
MRIIAGEARGRRLFGPTDKSIRPPLDRIRESIFAVLGDAFEGLPVLDLFAGTGSLGLEALSRGARRAVFVENSRGSIDILRRNIDSTGFGPRCEILRGDGLFLPSFVLEGTERFALAFLDPPFLCFEEETSRASVLRRVAEIVERGLLPGGQAVLRAPSRHEGSFPIAPTITRRYGESVVSIFAGPDGRPSPREV